MSSKYIILSIINIIYKTTFRWECGYSKSCISFSSTFRSMDLVGYLLPDKSSSRHSAHTNLLSHHRPSDSSDPHIRPPCHNYHTTQNSRIGHKISHSRFTFGHALPTYRVAHSEANYWHQGIQQERQRAEN